MAGPKDTSYNLPPSLKAFLDQVDQEFNNSIEDYFVKNYELIKTELFQDGTTSENLSQEMEKLKMDMKKQMVKEYIELNIQALKGTSKTTEESPSTTYKPTGSMGFR
jgi:hypothetical protein